VSQPHRRADPHGVLIRRMSQSVLQLGDALELNS